MTLFFLGGRGGAGVVNMTNFHTTRPTTIIQQKINYLFMCVRGSLALGTIWRNSQKFSYSICLISCRWERSKVPDQALKITFKNRCYFRWTCIILFYLFIHSQFFLQTSSSLFFALSPHHCNLAFKLLLLPSWTSYRWIASVITIFALLQFGNKNFVLMNLGCNREITPTQVYAALLLHVSY